MMTIAPRIGIGHDVDAYSLSEILAGNAPELQFQMRSHAVQATSPAGPIFASRWSTVDESPMSVGTPAVGFQRSGRPRSAWLTDALRTLAEVDDEIAEDGLPEVNPSAKREAERIIVALARHPWTPTVYPTQDAEIAIHFKSLDLPNSVVILLDSHGQGECYSYTGGHSRRAHYDVSSELPDGFVLEQLRALTPERMALPTVREGLGASAMMFFAGVPNAL